LNNPNPPHKLSIFGSYTQNSIGDKAILISLLDLLFVENKNRLFIYIICFDKEAIIDEITPYKWSKNISIVSLYPERILPNYQSTNKSFIQWIYNHLPSRFQNIAKTTWYSLKIIRSNLVFDSSGLIIGGGNLLMDLFPSWPYRVYLLSRKFANAGLPVIFAGVGAFPIQTRIGNYLLRESVRKASLVFVRDNQTKEHIIRNWKISAESHPDFALSYPFNQVNVPKQERDNIIAINFAPIFSKWWPYKDDKEYNNFLDALSTCLYDYFFASNPKLVYWFYDTNTFDRYGTNELIGRLLTLGLPQSNVIYNTNHSIETIVSKLSKVQLAIVTRLHAGLLALRVGTPILAIVYQPKVKDVLNNIGLNKGIIDFHEVSRIREFLDELNKDWHEFCLSSTQISVLNKANKEVVNEIFDTIFDRT
jgi:polysaccharide pyruvyl transferase WcaK-like protein